MGNGYGRYRTTIRADMAAYDAAPPELRRIMQQTVAKWASRPLVQDWNGMIDFGLPRAEVTRTILTMIRKAELQSTLKTYGPSHPEAPGNSAPQAALE